VAEKLQIAVAAVDAIVFPCYDKKCPGDWIIERMTSYLRLGFSQMRGQVFEHYVGEAMLLHGIEENRISKNVDVVTGKATEMDYLISPNFSTRYFAIHCKTSVRERWQQADRAAIISDVEPCALQGRIDHHLITWREKPEDTLEKEREFCSAKGSEFYSLKTMVTVMDNARVAELFNQIKGATKKAIYKPQGVGKMRACTKRSV